MNIPQNECIYIQKGGVVNNIIWDSEDRTYKIKDEVSDILFHYLREPCYLEDGVTLRDLFNILKRNMLFAKLIIGNWVEEIVSEGLSGSSKDDKLNYLEIYRHLDVDQLFSINNCDFHAVGFQLEKDEEFNKKGDIINYSLSMTNSKDIIDNELRLNNKLSIYNKFDTISEHKSENSIFTLYDVLYWPIWELSFHGGPTEREEKIIEVNNIVKEYFDNEHNNIIDEDLYARTQ